MLLACKPDDTPTQQPTVSPLTLASTLSPSLEPSPDGKHLSLAEIYPGERIENTAEEYGLHFSEEESADAARLNDNFLYAYSRRCATTYDEKVLLFMYLKTA